MITISAYIVGAIVCLAVQGAVLFVTLTIVLSVAAIKSTHSEQKASSCADIVELPQNRQK